MRLLIAALADYANIALGDKLNLAGVFDVIWVPQFPVIHPSMVLALRMQFEWEDGGRAHTLQVLVQDQDGKQYADATATMEIPAIEPGKRVIANQVLGFNQIKLVRPNRIAFVLRWDGEEVQRLHLDIEAVRQPPEQQLPNA